LERILQGDKDETEISEEADEKTVYSPIFVEDQDTFEIYESLTINNIDSSVEDFII